MLSVSVHRLYDVVQGDRKLYLVFEFLDLDLKKMMDTTPNFHKDTMLIKVSTRNTVTDTQYHIYNTSDIHDVSAMNNWQVA